MGGTGKGGAAGAVAGGDWQQGRFSEAWAKGEYIAMRTERKTLEAEPHHLLRLIPAR